MPEILTKKGVAILVDTNDLWVARYAWYTNRAKGHNTTYAATVINRKTVLMHRFLLGVERGKDVDHIDGNGLNNQRSNLRVCTRQQNLRNQRHNPGGNAKSAYKGVWKVSRYRWAAQIGIDRKAVYLGTFSSPEDAARAYNEAAVKHFGEFAQLNALPETA